MSRTISGDELTALSARASMPLRTADDINLLPRDSDEGLFLRLAKRAQEQGPIKRHSLTAWTPNQIESTRYIPHDHDAYWNTIGPLLTRTATRGTVLYCAPMYWHVEPLAHAPCKERGWSSIAIPENNIPLAVEAIHQLGIVVVIATAPTIRELRNEIARRALTSPVQTYVCVFGPHEDVSAIADVLSAQLAPTESLQAEVHLFPGFPLAHATIQPQREAPFTLNTAYVFHQDADILRCTGIRNDALPILGYPLPFTIEGAPAQGATTFTLRFHDA